MCVPCLGAALIYNFAACGQSYRKLERGQTHNTAREKGQKGSVSVSPMPVCHWKSAQVRGSAAAVALLFMDGITSAHNVQ